MYSSCILSFTVYVCDRNIYCWTITFEFTEHLLQDGNYTYDIPEQYATPNKCTRYCSLSKQNNVSNVPKRSLCIDCNKRESLKLSELSNFEPRNKNAYDTELNTFKENLEKKYPLCGNCKSTVRDVLNKQALWLTRYKMLFFKQKPIQTVINVSKNLQGR